MDRQRIMERLRYWLVRRLGGIPGTEGSHFDLPEQVTHLHAWNKKLVIFTKTRAYEYEYQKGNPVIRLVGRIGEDKGQTIRPQSHLSTVLGEFNPYWDVKTLTDWHKRVMRLVLAKTKK